MSDAHSWEADPLSVARSDEPADTEVGSGAERRGWGGTLVEGTEPTPTQTHRLGCGYAALETIARAHGLTLERLSDRDALARREMSLWDLSRTARRIGLRAVAGRVPDRRIEACRMPLIALIRYDQPPPDGTLSHYMVVFTADEREVVISDPERAGSSAWTGDIRAGLGGNRRRVPERRRGLGGRPSADHRPEQGVPD